MLMIRIPEVVTKKHPLLAKFKDRLFDDEDEAFKVVRKELRPFGVTGEQIDEWFQDGTNDFWEVECCHDCREPLDTVDHYYCELPEDDS